MLWPERPSQFSAHSCTFLGQQVLQTASTDSANSVSAITALGMSPQRRTWCIYQCNQQVYQTLGLFSKCEFCVLVSERNARRVHRQTGSESGAKVRRLNGIRIVGTMRFLWRDLSVAILVTVQACRCPYIIARIGVGLEKQNQIRNGARIKSEEQIRKSDYL